MPGGRPLKFNDPVKLNQMIDDYFAERDKLNKPYTVASLAVYLDTSRDTLWRYENSDNPALSDAIKRAKEKIVTWFEEQVATSKTPTGIIFLMKNYGYSDNQQLNVNTTVTHEVNPDQLEARITELLSKAIPDGAISLKEGDYEVT